MTTLFAALLVYAGSCLLVTWGLCLFMAAQRQRARLARRVEQCRVHDDADEAVATAEAADKYVRHAS